MDVSWNNKKAKRISMEEKIPGIVVSDGHRLADMGKAHTEFLEMGSDYDFQGLGKNIKKRFEEQRISGKYLYERFPCDRKIIDVPKRFENHEESCSNFSRGLYVLRLGTAIAKGKLSKL